MNTIAVFADTIINNNTFEGSIYLGFLEKIPELEIVRGTPSRPTTATLVYVRVADRVYVDSGSGPIKPRLGEPGDIRYHGDGATLQILFGSIGETNLVLKPVVVNLNGVKVHNHLIGLFPHVIIHPTGPSDVVYPVPHGGTEPLTIGIDHLVVNAGLRTSAYSHRYLDGATEYTGGIVALTSEESYVVTMRYIIPKLPHVTRFALTKQ